VATRRCGHDRLLQCPADTITRNLEIGSDTVFKRDAAKASVQLENGI
jgi:hypothetical protein